MNISGWMDISRPLEPGKTVVWPGDLPFSTWLTATMDPGPDPSGTEAGSPEGASGRPRSPANVTAACLSLHTGTHIDAPRHFIPGGKGIDGIPIEACIGPARLIHHSLDRPIHAADIGGMPLEGAERVLFRTTNAARGRRPEFAEDYVALLPEAARVLVRKGIRLVGIDYLSVGPPGPPGDEVHRILLGAEVVILEGLILEGLEPGDYDLVALPLSVPGSDGAPVRAALRSRSS